MSFRSRLSVSTGVRCRLMTAALLVFALALPHLSVAQPQPALSPAEQQAISLRQTVAALEAGGDTWHPQIAETMVSLAQLMQREENHEEALAMLERAVHVSRVNNGLFSLDQIPALDMQVESHMALGQWAEADSLRQYHFYIHSRAMERDDPDLIPALIRYAEWHLQSYIDRRVDVMPVTRVIDAYQLYSVALSIADAQPEPAAWPRERYLQRMAYIAWQLSLVGPQMRPEVMYARTRQVDDDWVERMTDGRHSLRPSTFALGEEALTRIIEQREAHLAEATADSAVRRDLLKQYVESVLELADWHLLFSRRQASAVIYQQAWDLVADEDEDLQREVFGKVVFIPAFDEYLQPEMLQAASAVTSSLATALVASPGVPQAEPTHGWPWVDMKFDLTRYGRVSNIELLNSSTEISQNVRRQMITGLRDSPMRPVVSAAGLENSSGWVYRFPYDPARMGIDFSAVDDEEADADAEEAAEEISREAGPGRPGLAIESASVRAQ